MQSTRVNFFFFYFLFFLLQTHIITYSALNLLTKRYNTYSLGFFLHFTKVQPAYGFRIKCQSDIHKWKILQFFEIQRNIAYVFTQFFTAEQITSS